MKEKHFLLTALLPPLAILLLLPADYSGKLALFALAMTIVLWVAIKYLPKVNIQGGRLLFAFFLAMPILSIGGCIKYTIFNSIAKHEFVLFNGSDQPMEIVFDSKKLKLNSRQTVKKTTFSSKMRLTDPSTGLPVEKKFPSGFIIAAYGADYELLVEEVQYRRLSLGGGNYGGGSLPKLKRVLKDIYSMSGDFWVYMPGEDVPEKMSKSQHDMTRYLVLSVKKSQFHHDRPREEEEVMKDAVKRALEKASELK